MRIYRTTDKIKYKLGELTIEVSPLSLEQKTQLQEKIVNAQKENNLQSLVDGSIAAIKFGLKSVSGLENADGSPYELQFENGQLTHECVQDLLNIPEATSLTSLCVSLMNGIPRELPKGVTIAEDKTPAKKSVG